MFRVRDYTYKVLKSHWNEGSAFAFIIIMSTEKPIRIRRLNPTNLSRIVLIVDIWHPDVDNELREKLLLV